MTTFLLDGSLKVEIYFEQTDSDYADNICLCLQEDCPDDEKILIADETNIYLTTKEARALALALNQAAEISAARAAE